LTGIGGWKWRGITETLLVTLESSQWMGCCSRRGRSPDARMQLSIQVSRNSEPWLQSVTRNAAIRGLTEALTALQLVQHVSRPSAHLCGTNCRPRSAQNEADGRSCWCCRAPWRQSGCRRLERFEKQVHVLNLSFGLQTSRQFCSKRWRCDDLGLVE